MKGVKNMRMKMKTGKKSGFSKFLKDLTKVTLDPKFWPKPCDGDGFDSETSLRRQMEERRKKF